MRISDIIRADFRSIISNTSALLVCAVLALLPSAYAWFNIIASWDPYSNTANLKVAIASEDQGVTSLGHHINIGDQVLENLKDNTQMGWIFTDPTTATSGVKHGDYYASVVIGSGFSADMMSFLSHEPKKPTLHYTVNEKINAIVPKITQKGVEGIEAQIESVFLGSLNESIFSEANSRGTQLVRMRTDIEKTRSLIDEIVPQLPRIHEAIEHTENLSQTGIHAIERVQNTLPDLESRLDRIRSVTGNRTEVHHTLESILADIPPFVQTQMVSLRGLMRTGINMAGTGNEFFSESADLLIPRLKGIERRMIIAKHIVHSLNTLFQALNQFVPIFGHGQTRTAQIENEIGKYIVLIQRASNMLTRGESLTHDLQGELMQRANAVESGYSQLTSWVEDEFSPKLATVREKMTALLDDLHTRSGILQDQIPGVRKSLETLQTAFIRGNAHLNDILQEWGKIEQGANKLQSLAAALSDDRIDSLLHILGLSPSKERDFFSKLIHLDTTHLFPIPNYGSAISPFFIVLSLWVGALLSVSLLSVRSTLAIKHNSLRKGYLGRLALFVVMGIFQSLILALGSLFLIKISVAEPLIFVMLCAGISVVFQCIVYSLVFLLGNAGKVVAILFLLIQLSAASGTFPVELTNSFFIHVHPYLPFTYAINAMREAVGGIVPEILWGNIAVLTSVIGIIVLGSWIVAEKMGRIAMAFDKRTKGMDVFH